MEVIFMKKKIIALILFSLIGLGGILLPFSSSKITKDAETADIMDNTEFRINPRVPVIAAPGDFVSVWNTSLFGGGSTPADSVRLPLTSAGRYDFEVDWGDTKSDSITANDQAEVTHNFTIPGVYTITISGFIEGWQFNSGGDRLKIVEISQWGCLNLGNSGGYFYGCQNLNLTTTDSLNLTGTTNLYRTFTNCISLGITGNLDSWNISAVTNMNRMFYYATAFNQPIGSWNTSSVTDMEYMFYEADAFNQPIGSWDVSNVNDMQSMFAKADAFNQPLANWDVSSVLSMLAMFSEDISFNQPLANWDVSSVLSMGSMFNGATNFSQNLGGWDVSHVTSMGTMFYNLKTEHYDALPLGWSQRNNVNGISFMAGSSKYGALGALGRQRLQTIDNWAIGDGGPLTDLDSDGDGLSDCDEIEIYNTDSRLVDTDGDNFLDGYEVAYGSDPTDPDDYPGVPADWVTEMDTLLGEDESLSEIREWLEANVTIFENLYTLVDGNATLLLQVIDQLDGNITLLELTSALATQNTDSLSALQGNFSGNVTEIREILLELGYSIGDTDYDGLDDLDELTYGTSLVCSDTDCDNLNDAFEVKMGTDPLDDDSDDDSWYDGVEVAAGTSPLDPLDYPGKTSSSPFPLGAVIGGGVGTFALLSIGGVFLIRKRKK
ncbi:MAG: BspA family leucine-rich repeat surface protein [Promethearchaeota archaeon]|nr:MAG: BspA family leucine-rich repeat surface protein [Candidatus Lokiarchaeota archaeon]